MRFMDDLVSGVEGFVSPGPANNSLERTGDPAAETSEDGDDSC
jgi:hypothetical protein